MSRSNPEVMLGVDEGDLWIEEEGFVSGLDSDEIYYSA